MSTQTAYLHLQPQTAIANNYSQTNNCFQQEVLANLRSRSAKLRAAEKLSQ